MDYAEGDSSVDSQPPNSNPDVGSKGMTDRLNTHRHLLEADRLLFIQSQEKVRTQWVKIEKLQKEREELTKNLHATKSKLHSTNDISDTQQLQALLKHQDDLDKEMEQEKGELVRQMTSCPSNVLHASVPSSAVPAVSSPPMNRDQSKSFMDYAKGDSFVVSQPANSNLDSDSKVTGMAVGLNTCKHLLEADRLSFIQSQEKVRTQWVKIEKLQKEREELMKNLHVVKSKLQLQALLTHLDDLDKEIELERAELARQIVYVDEVPEKAFEKMQNMQGLGSWSLVLACCGVQSGLVGWFILEGPSLTNWIDSLEVNFVTRFLPCQVEPILNFGFMLGFNELLALACFMCTFIAPKPVRQYNFARDITIASLIYCVIWVIFIAIL